MKLCKDCGCALPEESSDRRRFCDDCITRHKKESWLRKREKQRLKRETEAHERNRLTIAEVERAAREHGMSYGQYSAYIRG